MYFPNSQSISGGAASLIVKGYTGRLFIANYYNGNGATRYLQLFDATAVPANTAVPLMTVACPTGQTASLDYSVWGRLCTNGIVLVNSTTAATLTIGSADGLFDATFS